MTAWDVSRVSAIVLSRTKVVVIAARFGMVGEFTVAKWRNLTDRVVRLAGLQLMAGEK